ncbi:MAG TPA: glycosyltransferase family A protein [Methylomirabilota bacterium]|nr:glycosyltransferase family A protein [Methylomirabilota bacterium]
MILPTYNRASTLDRSIRSVLNQTFRDFELIIVDDGSTDESRKILERYATRPFVRVIPSRHRGCSVARNLGVSASSAPLVAFQDSDDEWRPDKLEKAVAVLTGAGDEVGVFYSDMTRVHDDGSLRAWRSPDVVRGVLVSETTLDYQHVGIGIQSAVIRRTCFARSGLFDEALPRFIDLDLFIRLSDHFGFHHSDAALVRYYAGGEISRDPGALVTARHHLIAKYRERLRAHRHHLAHQYLLLAQALQSSGSKYRSRVLAMAALVTSPTDPRIRRTAADVLVPERSSRPSPGRSR